MNRGPKRARTSPGTLITLRTTLSINPRTFLGASYNKTCGLIDAILASHASVLAIQRQESQRISDDAAEADHKAYKFKLAGLQADNNRAATNLQATIRALRTDKSLLETSIADSAAALSAVGAYLNTTIRALRNDKSRLETDLATTIADSTNALSTIGTDIKSMQDSRDVLIARHIEVTRSRAETHRAAMEIARQAASQATSKAVAHSAQLLLQANTATAELQQQTHDAAQLEAAHARTTHSRSVTAAKYRKAKTAQIDQLQAIIANKDATIARLRANRRSVSALNDPSSM